MSDLQRKWARQGFPTDPSSTKPGSVYGSGSGTNSLSHPSSSSSSGSRDSPNSLSSTTSTAHSHSLAAQAESQIPEAIAEADEPETSDPYDSDLGWRYGKPLEKPVYPSFDGFTTSKSAGTSLMGATSVGGHSAPTGGNIFMTTAPWATDIDDDNDDNDKDNDNAHGEDDDASTHTITATEEPPADDAWRQYFDQDFWVPCTTLGPVLATLPQTLQTAQNSQESQSQSPPQTEQGYFHVYLTPPKDAPSPQDQDKNKNKTSHDAKSPPGPLFVLHHGAGSSALSFALLVREMRRQLPHAGFLAFDARGHGSSVHIHRQLTPYQRAPNRPAYQTVDDAIYAKRPTPQVSPASDTNPQQASPRQGSDTGTDYSLETLTYDLYHVLHATQLFLGWTVLPPLLLVGHSLGGAVVTSLVYQDLFHLADASIGTPVALTQPTVVTTSTDSPLEDSPLEEGSLATDIRLEAPLTPPFQPVQATIFGYTVLDVVEGSALEALLSMKQYLAMRPTSFADLEEAITWHLRTRVLRNRDSALVSVPPLLARTDADKLMWRTDLSMTEAYWHDWFHGMSHKFLTGPHTPNPGSSVTTLSASSARPPASDSDSGSLSQPQSGSLQSGSSAQSQASQPQSGSLARRAGPSSGSLAGPRPQRPQSSPPRIRRHVAKLLCLAGTDRLDTALTIGQMQGKYTLHLAPDAGHFLHEDVPDKVAEWLTAFYRRSDPALLVLPPKFRA